MKEPYEKNSEQQREYERGYRDAMKKYDDPYKRGYDDAIREIARQREEDFIEECKGRKPLDPCFLKVGDRVPFDLFNRATDWPTYPWYFPNLFTWTETTTKTNPSK